MTEEHSREPGTIVPWREELRETRDRGQRRLPAVRGGWGNLNLRLTNTGAQLRCTRPAPEADQRRLAGKPGFTCRVSFHQPGSTVVTLIYAATGSLARWGLTLAGNFWVTVCVDQSLREDYNFAVSRHLKRVSDHATSIAEMVVFLVEGRNIRHATQQLT